MSLMPGLLIFAGVVFVLAVFMVATYNALVSLQARYKNAFSQIEVQLKRRYDLIPNLVETARTPICYPLPLPQPYSRLPKSSSSHVVLDLPRAGAAPERQAYSYLYSLRFSLCGLFCLGHPVGLADGS